MGRGLAAFLTGAGRGIERFGQATREQELFDLKRESSLLTIRQQELDIERARDLIDRERKGDLRQEEIDILDLRIKTANAEVFERRNTHEAMFGEKIQQAKLDAANNESDANALAVAEGRLKVTVAKMDLEDARLDRLDAAEIRSRANVVRLREEQLEDLAFAYQITPGADGKTPLEQGWEIDLKEGISRLALTDEQARAKRLENDTLFARSLLNSPDETRQALGSQLLAEITGQEPELLAKLRGETEDEDEEVPKGPPGPPTLTGSLVRGAIDIGKLPLASATRGISNLSSLNKIFGQPTLGKEGVGGLLGSFFTEPGVAREFGKGLVGLSGKPGPTEEETARLRDAPGLPPSPLMSLLQNLGGGQATQVPTQQGLPATTQPQALTPQEQEQLKALLEKSGQSGGAVF